MKVTPLHRSGTSHPLIWERVDMSKVQFAEIPCADGNLCFFQKEL